MCRLPKHVPAVGGPCRRTVPATEGDLVGEHLQHCASWKVDRAAHIASSSLGSGSPSLAVAPESFMPVCNRALRYTVPLAPHNNTQLDHPINLTTCNYPELGKRVASIDLIKARIILAGTYFFSSIGGNLQSFHDDIQNRMATCNLFSRLQF